MTHAAPALLGIPVEFILFGLTLLAAAVFHEHTLIAALAGLGAVLVVRQAEGGFAFLPHLRAEASGLVNLAGLLLGFAVLARHFEDSHLPLLAPRWLPDDWKGPFCLLLMVFVLSGFLDNIAAALIGGTVAMTVFRGQLHVGYLAALVAASNAGGAGSVVGDTTTTMLWIHGVPAGEVARAYLGAGTALLACGIAASIQQDNHYRIAAQSPRDVHIDWARVAAAFGILVGAVAANLWIAFPAAGVWAAIFLASPRVGLPWRILPAALRGAVFLAALVFTASLMPVDKLPPASWTSALILGFVSSVFDNIPLTKLALQQGGYDWGLLAYAVGFGGSMIWFGSSAGVALSSLFPQMRSVGLWLKRGWHVALAYLAGFAVMLALLGWHPGGG